MEYKFPLESDFVDSYINIQVLNQLPKIDYSLKKDAYVYFRCVHLDPISTKLANCSASRDRLNEFIETSDDFKEAKANTVANCKDLIMINYSLYKDNVFNITPTAFSKPIANDLKTCMGKL